MSEIIVANTSTTPDWIKVALINFNNIPEAIKKIPHWVIWKKVLRNDRLEKLPYDAKTGSLANTTNPDTWNTYETAVQSFTTNN